MEVGDAVLQVRALVMQQPDRTLRPEWNGAPVMVADGALAATGLIQPASRVEYRYRVRTTQPAPEWRDAFMGAFPDSDAEVRTVEGRSVASVASLPSR